MKPDQIDPEIITALDQACCYRMEEIAAEWAEDALRILRAGRFEPGRNALQRAVEACTEVPAVGALTAVLDMLGGPVSTA